MNPTDRNPTNLAEAGEYALAKAEAILAQPEMYGSNPEFIESLVLLHLEYHAMSIGQDPMGPWTDANRLRRAYMKDEYANCYSHPLPVPRLREFVATYKMRVSAT